MANFNEQGNRPDPIKVDAECLSCGKVDQVECSYYWDRDSEQWELLGPSWKYRCDACLPQYHENMRHARELMSPCPPSDFDPMYAGERWDED